MSSNNHGESDPHSSGYEGDISDQFSEVSTVADSDTVDESSSETSETNELKTGTIWIGCDVRDAGPGVQSDEDAEFGTIVIGCSIRDMGFENYQAYLNADDQATVEHIENVDEIADVEHSRTAAIDANNKKLISCKRQSCHLLLPSPLFHLLLFVLVLTFLLGPLFVGLLRWTGWSFFD
ncbi:hypothetical protein BDW67DRAFT_134202 [Aspergillus spinulosporus]